MMLLIVKMRPLLMVFFIAAAKATFKPVIEPYRGDQDVRESIFGINYIPEIHYKYSHVPSSGGDELQCQAHPRRVKNVVDMLIRTFHNTTHYDDLYSALINPLGWEDKDENCITNGRIQGLATILRKGPAHYNVEGNNAMINVSLHMKYLRFGIIVCVNNYRWGSVQGEVDSNSIDLSISLTGKGPNCTAKLNDLSLQVGAVNITNRFEYTNTVKVPPPKDAWVFSYFHNTIFQKAYEDLKIIVVDSLKFGDPNLCESLYRD